MSACDLHTSKSRCPAACTASVWKTTECDFATSPTLAISITAPVSLFAVITLIKTVSFLIAFSRSEISIVPRVFTGRYVTSKPQRSSARHDSSTAGCSTDVVIICLPLSFIAYAAPFIAQLSLSLPPQVKYISQGFAFIQAAIRSLASSTAFRARLPMACRDEAFPYISEK